MALPKPPGQRVRRNLDQKEWTSLPAAGRKGRVPKLPDLELAGEPADWLPQTEERWKRLWKSPMATTYLEADKAGLERLAFFWDQIERGTATGQMYSAAQNLEDRYGLSPKSRRQLQWEIEKGTEEASRPSAAAGRTRNLRVVAVEHK